MRAVPENPMSLYVIKPPMIAKNIPIQISGFVILCVRMVASVQ